MKKYLLLPFLVFPFLSQAQSTKGPYIGVTTQFQNTWIINDEQYEDVNYEHKFTTKWAPFGITAGYKFNENHNLQVELIRSKQGENFDIVDVNGDKTGEKEIDLVYWNVPLLFKYTTTGRMRFNFHFGPQISFLQKGTETNRLSRTATYHQKGDEYKVPGGTFLLASTDEEDRQKDSRVGSFNKYDLGGAAGAGVEFDVNSNTYISANLRGHYNFVNIRKEENINDKALPEAQRRDPDWYNLRQNLVIGIQVGVHFLFNTGDGTSPARHE
jgi:hypothetical protein